MKKVRRVAIGVVFRKSADGVEFLLLKRKRKGWELPKGGIEKGETAKRAALREVREETGLTLLKIVKRINEKIIYNYPKEYAARHGYTGTEQKAFLIESLGGPVRVEKRSFSGFAWLDAKNALRRLKWDNQRNLLHRILKGAFSKK
ncbi:MAG: NUDIX domain-containing protein [Candidatus Aenigmarchaeota archaeon]|nr:NUDIX domain-containing protein [Candidatus Aenigmarchaeota archaeon]